MKMVKSLLLGSAAGLFAAVGAQAADLPVKAKAVEYVKVCSLYGAGFYYIPGTDTCIKIGGFIRTEWNHNAAGSFAPYVNGASAFFTRATTTLLNRSRFITSFDVRSQTEYGTLRAYARAGWQWSSGDFQVGGSQCASLAGQGSGAGTGTGAFANGNAASPSGIGVGSSSCTYLDRAFIQFAGFTFGKTQSYFDFFNTPAYTLQTNWLWVDTGGSGTPVAAYTAQFGNGLSATVSVEDATESRQPVVNLNPSTASGITAGVGFDTASTTAAASALFLFPVGGTPISSVAGQNMWPDVVGNLRVDQAWGSAQAMGVLHRVAAAYYTGPTVQSGYPNDAVGWAVGGGLTLNMPWNPKDTLSAMITDCRGAARYCSNPGGGLTGSGAGYGLISGGSNIGLGWEWDAVYTSGPGGATTAGSRGGLELSRMWSAVGAFEHYWTPALRTSAYGGYMRFAAASTSIDTGAIAVAATTAFPGCTGVGLTAGCMDWSAWTVGSRTLWNPVANLDIGVDVLYTKVNSALKGAGSTGTLAGAFGGPGVGGTTGTYTIADTNVWSGILRIQRNFWP